MMGIYIKGMRMPKDNCEAVWQITITNNWIDGEMKMLAHDSVTNEFIEEVVEVPEPHGRLIDADDVKSKMIPLSSFSVQDWISEVELSNCRTVIEAEGE